MPDQTDLQTNEPTEALALPDPTQLPKGMHPLEVAARRGFGPLSPRSAEAWHGGSRPCVTCGTIVRRSDAECYHCGQDLDPRMVEKMRAFAGPWDIYEHYRPFPGISLERVIRQVRRGLITETSIVRGPSTDYQWRYAMETPGLCRYFERCWNCQAKVGASDTYCPACLTYLTFERPRRDPDNPGAQPAAPAYPSAGPADAPPLSERMVPPTVGATTGELEQLRHALTEAGEGTTSRRIEKPASVLGLPAWVWALLVVAAFAIGLALIGSGASKKASPSAGPQQGSFASPLQPVPAPTSP